MFNIDQIIEDLDAESIEDFSLQVHNEVDAVEQHIMSLRGGRGQVALIDNILASIENLKIQCRLVFLDPLLAYVQVVGEMVDQVYRVHFHAHEDLAELVLLMFDEIRAACDEVYIRHSLDVQLLNEFRESTKELLRTPDHELDAQIKFMLSSLAYRIHPDMVFKASEIESFSTVHNINQHEELSVFEDIAISIDNRHEHTVGRTEKILSLCLIINRYLPENQRVDVQQLTAAVYIHDMAMAYIADSILLKTSKFTSDDIMLVEQHSRQGYELLNLIPQWKTAALMVLQHHERFDGKGYPNGIIGPTICQGAKILAIADAFNSLTHKRADRNYSKSTLRALLEINKNNGTQFDPASVEALNIAVREK